ncbi:unnamed protein product [Trichogramma brassicae]|uniref:Uncharacterized protein n=1 Tax=Trichogramma brassicae TaxID=86971 RepID=A0A6H5I4M8_9HYME|nr:unnamed protein product [Trichogramma brassicae]
MNLYENRYFLDEKDRNKILDGSKLQDIHVDKILFMINKLTNNEFRSTLLAQNLDRVEMVPRDKTHIQIIHSCDDDCKQCIGGHWVLIIYIHCKYKVFIIYIHCKYKVFIIYIHCKYKVFIIYIHCIYNLLISTRDILN